MCRPPFVWADLSLAQLGVPLRPCLCCRLETWPACSHCRQAQRRSRPNDDLHAPYLGTLTSHLRSLVPAPPLSLPPSGSVAELLFDSRADASSADTSPDDKARATVYLSHLKGYKRMGTARVECVSGCECERSVLDGTWEQQATLMQIHSFKVGGRQVAQVALGWPPAKQRRGL